MLWTAVLASSSRFAGAAVLIAAATLFKGYPIAFGLLIALTAPFRFGLPMIGAIAVGLVLPFALQSTDYVNAQYSYWVANLSRDDRTQFPLFAGYQDFHMLLRVVDISIPLGPYRLLQMGTGLAVAGIVTWNSWRGIDRGRIVFTGLELGLCWMILFGPSTESSTYILLAPIMAREWFDQQNQPRWARYLARMAGVLFVVSVCVFALPHGIHRPVIAMGIQPLAALCLTAAVIHRNLTMRVAPSVPASKIPAEPLRSAA